jgi:hypothetical protein
MTGQHPHPLAWILFIALLGGLCACTTGETDVYPFSFGFLADVQYCDSDPAGIRYYRKSIDRLQECVDTFNRQDLAFAIHLGDFVDRDFASMDRVLPIFEQLKAPRYHALGNHDFSVEGDLKSAVPAKLGMEKRYYDFSMHGWRFIVLDGNAVSLYAFTEDSTIYREASAAYKKITEKKAPNAMPWNSAVGKTQIQWLKDTLARASAAGEKVIVFCHFPVYPVNAHNCWDDGEVVEVLESYDGVVAYINGHNHAGNYGEKKGIHYLTIQGMVDTPDQNAYAVAEVFRDRIEIHGFGRVPDRTLRF